MSEHNALTGSSLHEPKGAADASSGEVYTADGGGSGTWAQPSVSVVQVIEAATDFPDAVSGVRTLAEDTIYNITTAVDLGSDRLVLSSGTCLVGETSLVSKLTSTTTSALLTATDSSICIQDILFTSEGAFIDFTADTVKADLRVARCGIITGSIGTATSSISTSVINLDTFAPCTVTSGLVLAGAWFKLIITDGVAFVSAGDFLDIGTATFDSISIFRVSADVETGYYFLSGTSSSGNVNSGGVSNVISCQVTGGGLSDPLSGITTEDIRWEFRHNAGIGDTRADGLLSLTGNTTDTAIDAADTPVLVTGTWVVQRDSQMTGTTAGRITYNGERSAVLPITCRVSMEPTLGTNNYLTLYLAINGTVLTDTGATANVDSSDPKSVTTMWQYNFTEDDYIELYVANGTGTNDILVSSAIIRVN